MKKIISVLLAFVMMVSMVPVSYAAESDVSVTWNLTGIKIPEVSSVPAGDGLDVYLEAETGFALPGDVEISGIDEDAYFYSGTSGRLFITADAILGDITISADGVVSDVVAAPELPAVEDEQIEIIGSPTNEKPAQEVKNSAAEKPKKLLDASNAGFVKSETVDGVKITVMAEDGVFPADASLIVNGVSKSEEKIVEDAVNGERDSANTVVEKHVFDIKIVDSEGNELQPGENQNVVVSFELDRAVDENLTAQIYHVDDEGAATLLDTSVEDGAVVAETDGFSYYQVEFTYGELQYVLPGDETVNLADILDYVGLAGDVTSAVSSAPELFSVSNESGEWIVSANQAFTSEETLTVVVNGVEYVIAVTDAVTAPNGDGYPSDMPSTHKGTVSTIEYTGGDGNLRRANVYLPYGYNPNDKDTVYNVLYLIPGTTKNNASNRATLIGSDANGPTRVGAQLDYVFEQGMVTPFIAVAIDIFSAAYDGRVDTIPDNQKILEIENLISYMDSHYNTYGSEYGSSHCLCNGTGVRAHRALAGVSEGGWHMGRLFQGSAIQDRIKYWGYVSASSIGEDEDYDAAAAKQATSPMQVYVFAGSGDYKGPADTMTMMYEERGIPVQEWVYGYPYGQSHQWNGSFEISLYNFAQLAFDPDCECITGYPISITKTSADTSITNGNSCYSLAGAVYGLYSNAACTTLLERLTTDANGRATSTGSYNPGNYYIKEITAPKGYALDTSVHTVTVSSTGALTGDTTFSDIPVTDPVSILLRKRDVSHQNEAVTSGNMSLANAQYTIKFYGGLYDTAAAAEASGSPLKTWVVKTNENGFSYLSDQYKVSGDPFWMRAGSITLPIGTVVIQETQAPTGYLVDSTKYVVKITEDGSGVAVVSTYNDPIVPEEPIKGGVKVQKVDANGVSGGQGDGSLANAEFTIYNKNSKNVTVNGTVYAPNAAVMTIKTNASGVATTGEKVLPYGSYSIKETKAPTGYSVNSTWSFDFTISQDNQMINAGNCSDEIIRGGLALQKKDASLNENIPYGDASFKDIVFRVYNASSKNVVVNGTSYAPNAEVLSITTDANGYAATGNNVLPYGTYTVKEFSVPDGSGYAVNANSYTVQVRSNGVLVNTDPVVNTGNIIGGIKVQKFDAEHRNADKHGDATVEGAVFSVVNKSAHPVVVSGTRVNVGDEVMRITTDANGVATTGNVLPMGTYVVKEVSVPEGYKLNSTWEKTVAVRENNHEYTLEGSNSCEDAIIRGGISVQKLDYDTGENKGPGGLSLAGAEIVILNRSAAPIRFNGEDIAVYSGDFNRDNLDADGIVTIITTNADGVASTGARDLPYGTYEVYEVKAPSAYELNTEWHKTVSVREDGVIVAIDGDDSVVDELKRTDIVFKKEGIRGNEQVFLANVVFKATNLNTGESHILVMDQNGTFDSSSNPHTRNTNANDAAVSDDGTVNESKLDTTAGVWFGGGEPVDNAPDGRNIGAFQVGKYRFEELRSSANEGYELCPPFEVDVYKRPTSFGPYYVGDVKNFAPEGIGTTLVDKDTGLHMAAASGDIILVDTVAYSGLTIGREYTLEGVLMDKETEQELKINGEKVTVSKTFTASKTSGEIKLEFRFNADGLDGTSVVAFETLFDSAHNFITAHDDITDEDQTVSFPKIGTTASGNPDDPNEKEIQASADATVYDKVSYEKLEPGVTYTLTATLMDATSGESVKDASGAPVTATKTFKPVDSRDGTVVVDINVNASDLGGHSLVVFESLTINGKVIAEHADINDAGQTVVVPNIATTLTDKENGEGDHLISSESDTITLYDYVQYSNLNTEKTYTLVGTLVDKETGEPLKGEDGNDITASVDFTPAEKDGGENVAFTIPTSIIAGHSVVAFEELRNGVAIVAQHKDINDGDQTVSVPDVCTTLHDGNDNHEVNPRGEKDENGVEYIELVDRVSYSALVPSAEIGKDYTIHGKLMDKATGETVKGVNGEDISVTKLITVESPDGYVDVIFRVPVDSIIGKTVVAFEKIQLGTVVLAKHEDIDDEDQTVTFPEISTSLVDKDHENHIAAPSEEIEIIDRVNYTNLIPGKTYTLKGELMLKSKGKALKDSDGDVIVNTVSFKADESGNGFVDVPFKINSAILAGDTVVAYETLYREGRELFVHADIDDEDQSLHFPTISTTATGEDMESKIIRVEDGVSDFTIVDRVEYTNLIPGETYKVSGILRDKEDGGVVKDANGEAFVSEVEFKAEEANGYVDVKFVISADVIGGKTLVVFENLLYGSTTIASHEDINSEAQTVKVSYRNKFFKYDATTREGLAGAVFEIRDLAAKKGTPPQVVTSGEDGFAYFNAEANHEYSIIEVKAPEGYQSSEGVEYFVTVDEDGFLDGDTSIANIRGGTVIINKVNVVTGNPVAGCEITVYRVTQEIDEEATKKAIEEAAAAKKVKLEDFHDEVEPVMKDIYEKVFVQETDELGRIYFFTEEPGTYAYKETKTIDGYYLNSDEYRFEVASDLTVTGTVRFVNVPFGTVAISKVNKAGEPLKGAEISVYSEDGKILGRGVTGANGRVYFVSPGPGKYYFVETKAPEGYKKVDDKFHFEIASDYTIVGTTTLENERTPTTSKTGDNEHIWLWVALAGVSCIGTGSVIFAVSKKGKKKES